MRDRRSWPFFKMFFQWFLPAFAVMWRFLSQMLNMLGFIDLVDIVHHFLSAVPAEDAGKADYDAFKARFLPLRPSSLFIIIYIL